jgi:hypothetical protein
VVFFKKECGNWIGIVMISIAIEWFSANMPHVALAAAVVFLLAIADSMPGFSELSVPLAFCIGRLAIALILALFVPGLLIFYFGWSDEWNNALFVTTFALGVLVRRPWNW